MKLMSHITATDESKKHLNSKRMTRKRGQPEEPGEELDLGGNGVSPAERWLGTEGRKTTQEASLVREW